MARRSKSKRPTMVSAEAVVVNKEVEYEIEDVCAMMVDSVTQVEYYWTKWTGYPWIENTWESIKDLKLHDDLLAAAHFQRQVYFAKLRISKAIANSEPFTIRREIRDRRLRRFLGDFYVAEMTRFHEGLTMFLHEAESWRRR